MVERILDRRYEEDWRSMNFRTLVTPDQKKLLVSKVWPCWAYLDQLNEGACVGHGLAHEAAAEPEPHVVTSAVAFGLYYEAKKLDPWEGENYSGTSVLAGAKAYVNRGYATEYRWCLDMEDLIATIGYEGPVVIGVNWYEGMFDTDINGYIHVRGDIGGGHCVLVRAVSLHFKDPTGPRILSNVDMNRSSFAIHNSWGRLWGRRGICRLSIMGMQRLMEENGDFCIMTKRVPVRQAA